MDQIDGTRRRIEAADGLVDVLAAGWDAFSVIEQACRACERGSRELFPAFAFAGTAAMEGLIVVAGAPSFWTGHGTATGSGEFVLPDVTEVADALAGLAGAAHARLAAASRLAGDAADQAACAGAAFQAALVQGLLAGAGRERGHVR